jgi:hypothetical protein
VSRPLPGYARFHTEQSSDDSELSQTSDVLRLGVFGNATREDTRRYFGMRGGYNRLSTSTDFSGDDAPDDEEPLTGFFMGPTVGGSYCFSDFFSLGGEVEARCSHFSGEEELGFGEDTIESTRSTIRLRPSLVARFYL